MNNLNGFIYYSVRFYVLIVGSRMKLLIFMNVLDTLSYIINFWLIILIYSIEWIDEWRLNCFSINEPVHTLDKGEYT